MIRDIAPFAISKLPETIRQLAYHDAGLCQRLGIKTIARVKIGGDAYERQAFFETMRRAIDSGRAQVLDTLAGDQARVRAFGGRRAHVIVSSGRAMTVMRRLELLSADPGKRRRRMERLLNGHDLPSPVASHWRVLCNQKALTPDELDAFNLDLRDTPKGIERSLREQSIRGEISLDQLIPAKRRYYERLTLTPADSGVGLALAEPLIAAVRGAPDAAVLRLLPLLLAVAPAERALLAWLTEEVPKQRVLRLVSSAGRKSDPYTCSAALEIACARPTGQILAEMAPIAERLLGDFDRFMTRCNVFSTLVVAASALIGRDHELRRFSATWRRNAAFAHAALAHQSLYHPSLDADALSDFVFDTVGRAYYVGGLLDTVELPLWRPQWVMAETIAADVIGRLTNMLARLPPSSTKERMTSLVDGARNTLVERGHPLAWMFPGMLQGRGVEGSRPLPAELTEQLRGTWSTASPVEACALAANIAMTAEFPKEALAPYAAAISLLPTPVTSDEWKLFAGRLSSVAYAAAAARAPELAHAVAEALFRGLGQSLIEPEDDVSTILLEASAFHPARDAAMNWLGERLTVLAGMVNTRPMLTSIVHLVDEIVRHDPPSAGVLGRARALAKMALAQ